MLDARVKHAPRVRQADAAAAALEELHAELRLEPLHLARERRLRDIEPLRRVADVPFLYNGVKRAHILDLHTIAFPPAGQPETVPPYNTNNITPLLIKLYYTFFF